MPLSRSEEDRQAGRTNAEHESRLSMSDYVEARGILLPAVEYMKRAVEAARTQGKIRGDLLSTVSHDAQLTSTYLADSSNQAAEAVMSLGNVSSPRTNGEYFQQALSYLQTAHELPEYVLPLHLQT